VDEVIGEPVHIIANSVGGLVALQIATQARSKVRGVQLLNISLRMLHASKQSPLLRPAVAAFQRALRETQLGQAFFGMVAKPQAVKNVLRQAYHDPETVTDELVECILQPGLLPGAADVFLDFIRCAWRLCRARVQRDARPCGRAADPSVLSCSYSSGPLPEDLIAGCPVPVSMIWGQQDPWEKVEWGRELGRAASVVEFIELPGVGHCPQDEAPQQVNPLIRAFVEAYPDAA